MQVKSEIFAHSEITKKLKLKQGIHMSTFGAFAKYLIIALLAAAALIPGLNAVEDAIKRLKVNKESAATQSCYAIVERARGSQALSQRDLEKRQGECESRLFSEITAAYNPALFYICKTRQLVDLTSMFPNATSEAIETSAATPAYTDLCKKFDNSASQATSTASGT